MKLGFPEAENEVLGFFGRGGTLFSFIINQHVGPLFYIRSPALTEGIINKSQVLKKFRDLEPDYDEEKNQISIRIDNPSVAARITKYVFDPSSR